LPGEYVVDEVRTCGGYASGKPAWYLGMRRTDERPRKTANSFSRLRVRIEGVDTDFSALLASSPDDAKMTDADRLRAIRRILADVLEQAVAVKTPLPAELVQRAWRAVEG
jgi:hypothetical protein